MNQLAKRCVLTKLYELEDMLAELTTEVKDCYEFGRRSGEFFEVGDLVGFIHPVYLQGGCVVSKGEVEEVYTDKHKIKIYFKHYPGPSRPAQHVTFVVSYDNVFLIKGNDHDEECTMPNKKCEIEDVVVCYD